MGRIEYGSVCIRYLTEEDRDKKFSKPENYPIYLLSEKFSVSEQESHVFARAKDFNEMVFEMLTYLADLQVPRRYDLELFGDKTKKELGEEGKKILEAILRLHNNFLAPSRRLLVFK
jgi:hypothetical protein